MRNFLKYDDTQVIKYDSIILAVIYTIGHILIAIACNRIITGATLDMAAADAFIEPIINGFWFYLLLVYIKANIEKKINDNSITFISNARLGIYLAILYTIGHILIAMTCNRLLTGAPLNLAAIDVLLNQWLMEYGSIFFSKFLINIKQDQKPIQVKITRVSLRVHIKPQNLLHLTTKRI